MVPAAAGLLLPYDQDNPAMLPAAGWLAQTHPGHAPVTALTTNTPPRLTTPWFTHFMLLTWAGDHLDLNDYFVDDDGDMLTFSHACLDDVHCLFQTTGTAGRYNPTDESGVNERTRFEVSDGTATTTLTLTMGATNATQPYVFVKGTQTLGLRAGLTAMAAPTGVSFLVDAVQDTLITMSLASSDLFSLSYSIEKERHALATIHVKSGAFFADAGPVSLTLSVIDGYDNTTLYAFTLTVLPSAGANLSHTGSPALAEGTYAAATGTGLTVTAVDDGSVSSMWITPTTRFELADVSETGGTKVVEVQVKAGAAFDFETEASVTVSVHARDNADLETGLGIVLEITDVDDVVPDLGSQEVITLVENTTYGAEAGLPGAVLTVTDSDTAVASLSVEVGGSTFTMLNGGSDKLWTLAFVQQTVLDHEAKESHTVSVTVTDGGGNTATAALTATVNDANDAPEVVSVLPDQAYETSQSYTVTVTGHFRDEDEGDTLTYTVEPTAYFSSTGGVLVASSDVAVAAGTATVVASDGALSVSMSFGFSFVDNRAPVLTVTGSQGLVLTDGMTSTLADTGYSIIVSEPDGDTITLVGVTPSDRFELAYTNNATGSTVTLRFKGGVDLDFEAATSYVAMVTATDHKGLASTVALVTVSVTDADDVVPVIGAVGLVTVTENVTQTAGVALANGGITVTDSDTAHGAFTLSHTGGTTFTFVSGGTDKRWTLAFAADHVPDHEDKEFYTVTLTVRDAGGQTVAATLSVSVQDVNEAPEVLSTLSTRTYQTSLAYTVTVTSHFSDEDENDTLTYTVTPSSHFTNSNGEGVITVSSTAAVAQRTGSLVVSDGTLAATMVFTFGFVHNEAPSLSVSGTQTLVLTDNTTTSPSATGFTLVVTELDGEELAAVRVAPATLFELGHGAVNGTLLTATLRVLGNQQVNYEAGAVLTATVYASDAQGLESSGTEIELTVTDVDDVSPALGTPANVVVAEHVSIAARGLLSAAFVSVTDPDTPKMSLTLAVDDARFTMLSGGDTIKAWTLAFVQQTVLDHETHAGYTVALTVEDSGGRSAIATFAITVQDRNDAPVVRQPWPARTYQTSRPYTVTVTDLFRDEDENDTLSFSVTPAAYFSNSAGEGVITVTSAVAVAQRTGSLVVSDGSLAATLPFTFTFVDNELPVGAVSGTQAISLTDNTTSSGGDTGYTVVFTDADATDTIATVSVEPAHAFAVSYAAGHNGATATLHFRAGLSLDHETKAAYTATVRATDSSGGTSAGVLVTVSVTDVDDVPPTLTALALVEVAENTTITAGEVVSGAVLTVLDSDTEAGDFTVTHTDSARFTMVNGGSDKLWTLAFVQQTVLDHETHDGYTLTATVRDGGGQAATTTLTVSVTDVNEMPTVVMTLPAGSYQTGTTHVIDLTGLFGDPDANTTLTFTVSPATHLEINGGLLTVNSATEVPSTTANLMASDGSLTATLVHTYSIIANMAPGVTQQGGQVLTVPENTSSPSAPTGHEFVYADTDGDTIASVWVEPATLFTVAYTGGGTTATATLLLKGGLTFDHEATPTLTATVYARDSRGATSVAATAHVTVADVDDVAPVLTGLGQATRPEGTTLAAGAELPNGVLTVTDSDTATGAFTLSHSAAAVFTLLNDGTDKLWTLAFRAATTLDHESQAAYTVTVTVRDGGGQSATAAYTLTVSDVLEAPTVTATLAHQVYQVSTTVTTNLDAFFTDGDGDSLTYTKTGPSWLVISGSDLVAAPTMSVALATATVTASDGSMSAMLEFTYEVITRDISMFAVQIQQPVVQLAAQVATDVGRASAGRLAAAVAPAPSTALLGMLRAKAGELERGEITLERFLASNPFSFRAGAMPGGQGVLAFWGGGQYTHMEAKRDEGRQLTWDGSMFGGNVGFELRTDAAVYGLGLNHSKGEFDYTQVTNGSTNKGTLEFTMNTAFPYFSLQDAGGFGLHGMLVLGRGKMEANEGPTANDLRYTADLEQTSFQLGVTRQLAHEAWRLRGELALGKVKTSKPEARLAVANLAALSSDTGHVAVGLDYAVPGLAAGLEPTAMLGVRHDFGDAAEGWGVELGGRLAGTLGAGLEVATGVRYLARAGGYREYGIDGTFRYTARLPGLGLRWQVRPGYGIEVADHGLDSALGRLGDGDAAVPVARGMRIKAEAAYGLQVSHGLLTPSLTYVRGDTMRLYGLGLRYEVGAFRWTYGWRRGHAAEPERTLRVELSY